MQCSNYTNESSCKALANLDSHLHRICCTPLSYEYQSWLLQVFFIVGTILIVYGFYYIATHPKTNNQTEKKK